MLQHRWRVPVETHAGNTGVAASSSRGYRDIGHTGGVGKHFLALTVAHNKYRGLVHGSKGVVAHGAIEGRHNG